MKMSAHSSAKRTNPQVGIYLTHRAQLQQGITHYITEHLRIHPSIHPLGPYSVQSVGAAEAVSLAIGHNPGRVTTPTQYTSELALILLTSEG